LGTKLTMSTSDYPISTRTNRGKTDILLYHFLLARDGVEIDCLAGNLAQVSCGGRNGQQHSVRPSILPENQESTDCAIPER
jgi:hypothetical protein